MFIVRYLIAAVVLIAIIVAWGVGVGATAWHIVWIAGLGILSMQGVILALVAVLSLRHGKAEDDKHSGQLLVLHE